MTVSEKRRATIRRRSNAAYNRLSHSQKFRFHNTVSGDEIDVNSMRGDVDEVDDQQMNQNDVSIHTIGAESNTNDAGLESAVMDLRNIGTASVDEIVMASTNSQNRSNNDTNGSAASKTHKKLPSPSFSEMSEHLHHVAEHVVQNPPVRELNAARKMAGTIINNDRVQYFILALIVINSIMMGAATFPAVKDNPDVSSIFELIDQIFLWIFTIEAAMQLAYHGCNLFKDAWLVFDLLIVGMSWALEGVKVARAFRIFRALRLIARVDVMRNLIKALIAVIPNLTGILMLLFLAFYIFAVMFTQLYKDTSKLYPRTQQYFVGLPETFFTLFQMMTLASQLLFTVATNTLFY